VTLTFISSVFFITTPILLRLVSIYPLVFVPSRIFGKLELWRLVTPFLFGGKGIGAIFDAFLLGRNSMELETGHFGGRTADYGQLTRWTCWTRQWY
jgi:Derlin-2/3